MSGFVEECASMISMSSGERPQLASRRCVSDLNCSKLSSASATWESAFGDLESGMLANFNEVNNGKSSGMRKAIRTNIAGLIATFERSIRMRFAPTYAKNSKMLTTPSFSSDSKTSDSNFRM